MSVSQGRAHYGIVPIENSLDGGINQVIDLFMESPLRVVSEIYLKIHQNLMAKDPKAPVRMICSHPQGFAQCRRWLSTHYADIERMEMPSTSAAAGRAASEPGVAAIASAMAARINGLDLIEQAIEDNPHNITRFFVVSRHAVAPSGHGDKTSLMLSIKDEPGALCSILTHFRDNGLNLTRIESRPSKMRAWEYFFFIDLEGHEEEPRVQQALHEVERLCRQVQILGSYPAAERLPMPVHGEVS
jgi:chorismate mutase/prephenate dehydratase